MGARSADRFAHLYAEHFPAMVSTARILLGDTAAAEEAVQEAFVRMHRAWRRVRPETEVAYLRTVVVNECRGRLRRRGIAARCVAPEMPPPAQPDEHALQRDDERAVAAALDCLPERQRECIVLRYWLDLREDEIATALGISAGTVKTHVHRAMATLEAVLEEHR